METRYLQFNDAHLRCAADLIRRGELVAFPTETVYGLGCDATDEQAVKRTYLAKGRPSDNPLIVHVWSKGQIPEIARDVSPDAQNRGSRSCRRCRCRSRRPFPLCLEDIPLCVV